jgi:hypothetical protein
MELNLRELDNMKPYDTFDYNSYEQYNGENYWENPKIQEKQVKKKKVTFNDILSNMNLLVNKEGVLQFMSPNQEESNKHEYNSNEIIYHRQQHHQQQYHQQYQQQPQHKNSEPLDQSIKHSYIYNKYFKDYGYQNAEIPEPRVAKTIEEYHQMLLEDKIKVIQHRKKIEQIKSKKMMFTSAPGSNSNPRNILASKNNLRMMNFR